MDVAELKEKKVSELLAIANSLEVEGASSMRKQELNLRHPPGASTD